MKKAFWFMVAAFLAASLTFCQSQAQAPAAQSQQPRPVDPLTQGGQARQQVQPQVYGRGRGGLPWAWNDRDRNGICDLTGQPVGQGRPIGFGGGRVASGWGRMAAGRARGGRGWGGGGAGWRFVGSLPAPPQMAPSQPPKQ